MINPLCNLHSRERYFINKMLFKRRIILNARLTSCNLQLYCSSRYTCNMSLAGNYQTIVNQQRTILKALHLLLHIEAIDVVEEFLISLNRHRERNLIRIRATILDKLIFKRDFYFIRCVRKYLFIVNITDNHYTLFLSFFNFSSPLATPFSPSIV